jgi:hypothetical protein
MKKFTEHFIEESLSEQEIDEIVESIEWEDIEDLYEENEFESEEPETLSEKISAQSRLRRGQKMKQRGIKVATARKMKLKRPATMAVLSSRAKSAARRAMMKKLLKGRDKNTLSADERDRLEARIKNMIAAQPGIVMKSVNKVRSLERTRLSPKAKKK